MLVDSDVRGSKHVLVGAALAVALISFIVQTEAASRMAALNYRKPMLMLYLTHTSWVVLFPAQSFAAWLMNRKNMSLKAFTQRVFDDQWHIARQLAHSNRFQGDPMKYMRNSCVQLACALNVAGASWYIAVNWTTPGDLTAIYNCSAVFVYAFSVPFLGERLSYFKGLSVLVSVIGVFIIAYGDQGTNGGDIGAEMPMRLAGNIVIALGAVLFGLYEVLYKRLAGAPVTTPASEQAVFACFTASLIGLTNIILLWPFLILFHITGIEKFELPHGHVAVLAAISVGANCLFSGSFLSLMSLTSPIIGAIAQLLTTFLVPIVDYALFGQKLGAGSIVGGVVIILGFGLLTWAEMETKPE